MVECQDCEDCGLLVCPWCLHHVHNGLYIGNAVINPEVKS